MKNFDKYYELYGRLVNEDLEEYLYGVKNGYSRDFNIDLSIKFMRENGIEPSYPKNAKYIVVATHDVDNIYPSLGLIKYYMGRNPLKALRYFLGRIRRSNYVFLNLDRIIERETVIGFRSTFFLLVSDRDVVPFYRSYYGDEIVHDFIKKLIDKTEFGLHTGYYSFDDPGQILLEKKRVEEIIGGRIYGVRNHYLNFKAPQTWKTLSATGFLYDTTFGFNNGFGYRNKMCHPYIPFDPLDKEWIRIWEIPLTIMDRALINLGVEPDKFLDKYLRFIEEKAVEYGCFITLLWHNDLLYDPRFKKYGELYWRIIEYTYRTEGIVLNGIEALRAWINTLEHI